MSARDKYLRKHYNISEEEYNHLLFLGNGGCWICGKPPKLGGSLNVDHDHYIQKNEGLRQSIRGLLCGFPCNKKLIGRNRRQHAHLYQKAALYLTVRADETQMYLMERSLGESTVEDKKINPTRKGRRRKAHLRKASA